MKRERDIPVDLHQRLRRHAESVVVVEVPVHEVMARGRERQQRRRTATGVLAVVAVGAGVMGAVQVLSKPEPAGRIVAGVDDATVVTDRPATTIEGSPTTVPGVVPEVPSSFVWNAVVPDSAEAVGMTMGPVAGDGPYLVWSTQPADSGAAQRVLWQSDDGASWRAATQPPVAGTSLAAYHGTFFTFGTAPDRAGSNTTSHAAVATSTDDGETWSIASLPIDVAALESDVVPSVGVFPAAMAAGPAGILTAVRLAPQVDWDRVLPGGYALGSGMATTAAGVAVGACADVIFAEQNAAWQAAESIGGVVSTVSEAPTTTAVISDAPATTTAVISDAPATTTAVISADSPCSYGWDELGIGPEVVDAIQGGLRFYLSTDEGRTFQEVPAPGGDAMLGNAQLAATASGFAVWTLPEGSHPAVWSSPDGRSWTALDQPPPIIADSLVAWGDRLVMSGWSALERSGRSVLAVHDPATGWTVTDLAGMLRPSDGVTAELNQGLPTVGPLGISLVAWVFVDPVREAGGTEFTRDGITVRAEDGSGNFIFLDADTRTELGRLIAGTGTTDLVVPTEPGSGGPIEVRRSADADPVTFTWDELVRRLYEPTSGGPRSSVLLLHSTDGVTWSRDSLSDAAGEPIDSATGVRAIGSQLVVAATRPTRDGSGVPEQILLVATPRS